MSIPRFLPGTTIEIQHVSSGNTFDSSSYNVFNDVGSSIASGALTSSGNGFYYAAVLTNSLPGYYVAESIAVVNGLPYKKRKRFEVGLLEVD